MPDELRIALAFALAFGASLVTVPLAIRLAWRTNFLDHPAGYKKHGKPTPYLGGLAVMVAFAATAVLLGGGASDYIVLLSCTAGLCAVGMIDDRIGLGPATRVLAAVTAAVALWQADLGWALFDPGAVNLLLTVCWVVGLVNAFNLMDNLDGASGTVGAVSATGIGLLAATQGEVALAGLMFALAGACAGFLRFNLARPTRIFLGDGGSMPVGFLLAAGLMAVPPTIGFGTAAVFAVIPLVGLPVLDTALVIVSRLRRGVNVFSGGRDHLTHRLLNRLGSPQAVALTLAVAQGALCGLGVLLYDATIVAVFAAASAYVLLGVMAIVALEWPYVRGKASLPALANPASQESRP